MTEPSQRRWAASVALLSQAVATPLSYSIPDHLQDRVAPGVAVVVPLQQRLASGIVVEVGAQVGAGDVRAGTLKAIHALLDDRQVLNSTQLELARWIAAEYYAPLGRCCALMTPPGFTPRSANVYSLSDDAAVRLTIEGRAFADVLDARSRILHVLRLRGPLVESKLVRAMRDALGWRRALKALVSEGVVSRSSTLRPPQVQPRRTTLAQLAIGEATLELVLANLEANRKLKPETRTRRADVLSYLQTHDGLAAAEWIFAETGATRADLNWLAEQSYIMLGDAERWRDPLADVDYIVKTPPPLTEDQEKAWHAIQLRIENEELRKEDSQFSIFNSQFLLRGVTGSGKTEIYMRAVEATLRQGRGAIILVPEISLTPQTVRRFLERFPGRVALIHSRLKPGERYDTWRRIRAGELRLVVGARSALFAPVPDLGLIILDEEHDASYKQNSAPFYDARQVAVRYAELADATLIFGSATPSLEAWRMANGEWRATNEDSPLAKSRLTLLELPNRVRGHVQRIADQQVRFGVQAVAHKETDSVAYQALPPVQVIDMRAELRGGNTSMFSGALALTLEETLRRGEQAILFLNRRGAASSVLCRDCGHVMRCPNDDTPLTYHAEVTNSEAGSDRVEVKSEKLASDAPFFASHLLKCHQCNHAEPLPSACPVCRSPRIRYIGIGTQKVEQAIVERFPKARVVRWDRDSAGRSSADGMLSRFVKQQADVLVGTQMIAKGLDLPMVTLVGVVLADVGLFLPDFRASERVFNLLAQVAGRAGRGLLPGRVIVQTYNPDHPAITFAARHDVKGFAHYELVQRKALHLPPFTRLVRFEYADKDNEAARLMCEALAQQVRRRIGDRCGGAPMMPVNPVIGPAQAYFTRRNKRYRWQVIVRTTSPRALLDQLEVPRGFVVDVDPVTVL